MAKILLVEDDEDISDNAALFLEHKGHQVTIVDNGADGLEQMRYGNFEIIILDGHLPDMDGLELCNSYREEGGKVPVLMATGRSSSADQQRGQEVGVNGYIVKPYSLEDLLIKINSILSSVPG